MSSELSRLIKLKGVQNKISKPVINRVNALITKYKNTRSIRASSKLDKENKKKQINRITKKILYVTESIKCVKDIKVDEKINTYKKLNELCEKKKEEEKKEEKKADIANEVKKLLEKQKKILKEDKKDLKEFKKGSENKLNEIAVLEMMRKKRVVKENKQTVYQYPISQYDFYSITGDYEGLIKDKYCKLVDNGLKYIKETMKEEEAYKYLRRAHEELYKDPNVASVGTHIQLMYVWPIPVMDDQGRIDYYDMKPYYTRSSPFTKNMDFTKLVFKFKTKESSLKAFIIGYKIYYATKQKAKIIDGKETMVSQKIKESTIRNLKAYYPSSNRKYHELTTSSTSDGKICIYETFLDVTDKLKLKYLREEKKQNIRNMLKEEGNEIEQAVLNGELINALEMLTKKYNEEIIITFYKLDDLPIVINNGETKEITKEELKKYEGKKCFLYEKGVHVAPSTVTITEEKKVDEKKEEEKKEVQFVLRPTKASTKTKKIGGVIGFEMKTETRENNEVKPVKVTLYGYISEKEINKSFDGENCIDKLTEYIYSITTKIDNKKSKSKVKIPYINVYGFSNSDSINLMMHNNLHKLDPNTKFVYASGHIKYIKYNNIRIYDLALLYGGGSTKKIKKDFKIDGDENSKVVYEIGMKHIDSCIGKINGKDYNLLTCSTFSSLSIKTFTQAFLKENIKGSKKEVLEKEQKAYFGGRTDIFKKSFNGVGNEKLYHIDINSAHPASMLEEMPFEYIGKIDYDDYKIEKDDIVKTDLYLCRVEYNKNEKGFIPNIMTRIDDKILCFKNVDYSYHWGAEILEAVENGCDIYIKEVNMYTKKTLFDEFVKYFYEKRNLAKKNGDLILVAFYKNILNSLYGKFSQNKRSKIGYANDTNEMNKIIKDGELLYCDEVGDKLMFEYTDKTCEYSLGALTRLSSYISALTRCTLSKMIRHVGYDNVYYCATDAIFTSVKPDDKYLDQEILGKWKIEAEIKKAVFVAPGVYSYQKINNKYVKRSKGIIADKLKYSQYTDVLNGKKETINQNISINHRSTEKLAVEETERKLKANYGKRIFDENGNSEAFENIDEYLNSLKK